MGRQRMGCRVGEAEACVFVRPRAYQYTSSGCTCAVRAGCTALVRPCAWAAQSSLPPHAADMRTSWLRLCEAQACHRNGTT